MKKQIAVLMAAATAVTTVAPALAHADNYSNVSANIVAKAKEALAVRYADKSANGITVPNGSALAKEYLNSRYIVLLKTDSTVSEFKSLKDSAYSAYGDDLQIEAIDLTKDAPETYFTPKSTKAEKYYVVDDITKLENVLERDNSAKVYIVDKGAIDGNKSYRETSNKYYVNNEKADEATQQTLANALKGIEDVVKASKDKSYIRNVKVTTQSALSNGEYTVGKDETKYVEKGRLTGDRPNGIIRSIKVKLASDKEITLEVNGDVLDFTKTYAKNSDGKLEEIKLFNKDSQGNISLVEGMNTDEVLKRINVVGTEENTGYAEGLKNKVMAAAPGFSGDVYTVLDQTPEKLELKNIYTREGGYTKEGADFVNSIIKARRGGSDFSFNFNGVNYILDGTINFKDAQINTSGKGYVLTLPVKVRNANDLAMKYTLRFEVYGDSQKDLYDVLRDLQGNIEVVVGHFTKLAGSNRYATAIAVSQEQFKPETADSVVIVGGYAQMDGLAAAPLASAKNAPILLADPKTGISEDTMKEIKRACKSLNNRTVYIVGGPHSVPMSVEKQLEKEFGAVVVRSYGVDRNATSLAVARRLFYDGQTDNRVFVVGRDGGADAMGVASVASTVKEIGTENQLNAQKDALYKVETSKTKLANNYKEEYDKANLESAKKKAEVEAKEKDYEAKKADFNQKEIEYKSAEEKFAPYKDDLAKLNEAKTKLDEFVKTSTDEAKKTAAKEAYNSDEVQKLMKKKVDALTEADAKKAIAEIDNVNAAKTAMENAKTAMENAKTAMENAKTAMDNAKTAMENINGAAKTALDKFLEISKEIDKNAVKYTVLNGRTVSPIIVVNKNGMDRVTRDFIQVALKNNGYNNNVFKAYIIGGENSVSSNVRRELKVAVGNDITRLAGKDRYETNVDVIKNFYEKGKVGGAIFTSGEDKYLVDSQTAGFFAASKNAPIVLTSNKLTSSQVDLMKKKDGVLYEQRAGIYQVGGVVSADVMKNVVQLLGL